MVKESLNIGLDVATATALGGLSTAADPSIGTFDLDDLNKHSLVEHDGSLSRADFAERGHDAHTFRPDIFDTVLSFFRGSEVVTVETPARARLHRINQSRMRDRNFHVWRGDGVCDSYGDGAVCEYHGGWGEGGGAGGVCEDPFRRVRM